MPTHSAPSADERSRLASRSLAPIYIAEALTSLASNLLLLGIFFFTQNRYHWIQVDNFALAAAQGGAYVIGALKSDWLSRKLGSRRALIVLWLALSACAAGAGIGIDHPRIVTVMLIAWSGLSAMVWPLLESICSTTTDPHEMSRRIGRYNLVWAGVAALTVMFSGVLIKFWPVGIFVIAAAATMVNVISSLIRSPLPTEPPPPDAHAPALRPEERLLHQRTLALWLSRLCMPAMYVVLYSIAAIMPFLPTIKAMDPVGQTIVGSLWMSVRVVMFVLLGATVWWHGRPRVLLIAAAMIFFACLAIPFRPSQGLAIDVSWLIFWQVVLGIAQGMIYTASLYFGMVLSEASTEHGGYHEALIGLGSVVGPGAAAMAAAIFPGSLWAGMTPVAIIMGASVAGACVASIRLRKRKSPI